MPDLEEGTPTRLDIDICRTTSPNVAVRSDGDGNDEKSPDVLEGHFSTFNEWYEINSWFEGHFLERIAPGAFKRTFNAAKSSKDLHRIQVLLEHGYDPTVGDKPLGVPTVLEEDSTGARYEAELFDSQYVRDLLPAFRSGVYGSSFRFAVVKDEWNKEPEPSDENPAGLPERTIKEVRVAEFGPTVFPANPAATAGVRSVTDEYYEKLRSRNPDAYESAVERTAKTRGIPANKLLVGADVSEPEETEDSPESHSDDSRSEVEPKGSPAHSSDSRKEHSSVTKQTTKQKTKPARKKETPVSDHTDEGLDVIERMSVSEREARVEQITARLTELRTEWDGAVMDDDAKSEWDSLLDERGRHEEAIDESERREEQMRAIVDGPDAGRRSERASRARSRSVTPASRVPKDVYDLNEYKRSARSLDDMNALVKEGAKRAVADAVISGAEVDSADAKEQASKLLETIDTEDGVLAKRFLVTGSPVYQRAFGKVLIAGNSDGLTLEERAALAAGSGATGGYAVPFSLDPTVILTSNGSINPLRQISRVVQIATTTWQGVTSAGITVSRANEGAQAGDNAPTLAQPEATPSRVQGFIPFSVEIEQDWSALRSEMTTLLADAKEEEEASSFVLGNGTAPNPAGIVATLASASDVETEGAFTSDHVYAVEEALAPRFRGRGRWIGNKSVYNTIRRFAEADGHDLWERIGNGQPAELLGYPAHELSTMASDVTANDSRLLVFGDFSQFLIVDRVGMTVELVPHLFGADRRPTGQRGFYAVWRNTSKVLVDNAFRALLKSASGG
jgi:HK97 family phage major capsid protein/HK97 family phage prohead protease